MFFGGLHDSPFLRVVAGAVPGSWVEPVVCLEHQTGKKWTSDDWDRENVTVNRHDELSFWEMLGPESGVVVSGDFNV